MQRLIVNLKIILGIIFTLLIFQNVEGFVVQQRIVTYYDNEIMLKILHHYKELKIQVENMSE
jgi:hypothetical protein